MVPDIIGPLTSLARRGRSAWWSAAVAALLLMGLLQPAAAFASPPAPPAPTVPAAPVHVHATAGYGYNTVSWSPAGDGGSPIIRYLVESLNGPSTISVTNVDSSSCTGAPDGNLCAATISGVPPGASRSYTVLALNAVGTGAASARSNTVAWAKGVSAPDAPGAVSATVSGGAVTVSWTMPGNGGSPITGYEISTTLAASGALVGWTSVAASGTSATLSGLQTGRAYRFAVQAVNAAGWSALSARSNTVALGPTTPSAPQNLRASIAGGVVTVSWNAPGDGGSGLTGYLVRAYLGSTTTVAATRSLPGTQTNLTLTGTDLSALAGGQAYTFTVTASNALGSGPESSRSNTVSTSAPTVPGRPTNVQAVAGNASATVTWSAPSDGGSPITGYIVVAYVGSTSTIAVTREVVGNVTSVRLIGVDGPILTNGVAYSFTVIAQNALGSGAESDRSNLITPHGGTPDAPTGVHATAGKGSAVVSWTVPYNGGSPITGYIVKTYLALTGQLVSTVAAPAGATSVTVPGLTNGASYRFSVTASNAAGSGPESARSDVLTLGASVPGRPTGVQAVASAHAATVSWTAPDNGGSAITGYTVAAYAAGSATPVATRDVDGTTTSMRFIGVDRPLLSDGATYTFTVTAKNALGQGAASAPSNPVTLPTAPTAPRNVAASWDGRSVTVRWDPPANNGGTAVTGYTVTVQSSGHGPLVQTVTGTSAVLSGLALGATYSISVVAVNAVGQSGSAGTSIALQNQPPTLTVPGNASAQYGASVSFGISARDATPGDHVSLSAAGLPAGLTFRDAGDGTGTVTGIAQVPAGTYTVTFSASDGHNPTVSASTSIVVSPQAVTIRPLASSPTARKIKKKNTFARSVTLRAMLSPSASPGGGDLSRAAVTYTLTRVETGGKRTCTAGTVSTTSTSLSVACSFRRLPVGVYRVEVDAGGPYYSGSAQSLLAVYHVKSGLSIHGHGSLRRPNGVDRFTYTASYGAGGAPGGTFRYVGHGSNGQEVLAGTSIDAIVREAHTVYIVGRASLNGTGGYRFILTATNNGYRNKSDQVGLWVAGPDFTSVGDLSFSPLDLSTGRAILKSH